MMIGTLFASPIELVIFVSQLSPGTMVSIPLLAMVYWDYVDSCSLRLSATLLCRCASSTTRLMCMLRRLGPVSFRRCPWMWCAASPWIAQSKDGRFVLPSGGAQAIRMGSIIEIAMSHRKLLDTDSDDEPEDSPLHRTPLAEDSQEEGYTPTTPTDPANEPAASSGARPTSTSFRTMPPWSLSQCLQGVCAPFLHLSPE